MWTEETYRLGNLPPLITPSIILAVFPCLARLLDSDSCSCNRSTLRLSRGQYHCWVYSLAICFSHWTFLELGAKKGRKRWSRYEIEIILKQISLPLLRKEVSDNLYRICNHHSCFLCTLEYSLRKRQDNTLLCGRARRRVSDQVYGRHPAPLLCSEKKEGLWAMVWYNHWLLLWFWPLYLSQTRRMMALLNVGNQC